MKKLIIILFILTSLKGFSQNIIWNHTPFTGDLNGTKTLFDVSPTQSRSVAWSVILGQLIKDSAAIKYTTLQSRQKLIDSLGAVINAALSGKQATLVSGTNIKTINTISLLGSGDITINGTLTNDSTFFTPYYVYGINGLGRRGFYQMPADVIKDANGVYWQLGITTGGALTTTVSTNSAGPTSSYLFTGTNGQYTLGDGTYATRLSLTTTGSSGASTFNPATGVLNIPQYSGGGGGPTLTYTPTQNYNAYGVFVNNTLDSTRGGTIIGTAGAGYYGFTAQSTRPSVPSGLGMREYVDSVGRRTYLGANNLSRSFDPGGQSANRVYKFQDRNYTFADSADVGVKLNITDTANIRFRPHAGTNITLSGSYPDITFNASGGGSSLTQQRDATTGTTVTVTNQTGNIWLIKDPASTVATYTITYPATPVDGQELRMSFGGSLSSGDVVTSIAFNGNGKTIIQGPTSPSNIRVGESLIYQYELTTTSWRRIK